MSEPKLYVPGDPRFTQYIKQLVLISGLIERSTCYYVTSSHWGLIAAEIRAQYVDDLADPLKLPKFENFKSMKLGLPALCLTVINSGTEDQEVCNLLNEEPARVANFGARREKLRSA